MALEYLGGVILFSVDSPYDQSMALGASGSMRYIYDEFSNTSMKNDFPAEIAKNGLEYLPNHRYVKYGATYYSIIKTFVTSYVKAYYDSEEAIQSDSELQTWAARASVSEIKHHFMNGRVSWHIQAAPFSAPALYNTSLPTEKGVDVDVFDYVVPSDVFPLLSYMAVRFYRPIPAAKSVLSAYTTSPFSDETVLQDAIAQFQQSMAAMEIIVDLIEAEEKYPDMFVKPSMLPWFSYI
ncbi:Lipoxygenase [Phytophthora infestans]|uniref:Lipoxygenase n=1 Tax=Phytophthora infestans TaxID=4787 RepID=A0A833TT92_PHYIN|nr:Lipoxygenase [Phytophthora infestans]